MLWVPIPKGEFRVAKPAGNPQGLGACIGLKGSVVCVTILRTQTQCYKLGPKISKPTSNSINVFFSIESVNFIVFHTSQSEHSSN